MKLASINSNLTLIKKGTTSGGSRNFFIFKKKLPLILKAKKLMIKIKSNSGRNNTGSVVVNTRKSRNKNNSQPNLNHKFRALKINFVANFILLPKINKGDLALEISEQMGCLPSNNSITLFLEKPKLVTGKVKSSFSPT
jgi:hypothetical protein